MKGRRILTALGGILVAGLLGATSFAITGDAPADLPPLPQLPPPGALVGAAGPDGEPIICPDGQPLKVEVPGPPPDIPGGPDVDDSLPQTRVPSEEVETQPLVPTCGPNDEPAWKPVGDEASTVHSLGFDGTCDVSARVHHTMVWGDIVNGGYQFDFDATGSCTGRLDDEPIQAAPMAFSVSESYTCPTGLTNPHAFKATNLRSTLNFSGTYPAGIDTAVGVTMDYWGDYGGARWAITGQDKGAAMLTGTHTNWVGPCTDSTGTFTGVLTTLQPLEG
jgi:hypothetical protein